METALAVRDKGELAEGSRWARPISRGRYLGLIGLLTAIGLAVMALETLIMYTQSMRAWLDANPMGLLGIMLVSLVAAIAGIVMQLVGRNRKGMMSIGLVVGGYALLVLSFGFAMACGLLYNDLSSIFAAFAAAAGLSVVMTVLGFAFPRIFQRIAGVLFVALIGVVIAEVVLFAMGVSQSWIDWVVLALFCGFIAVDTYRAAQDEPTVGNALFWASSIYVDFVNIFLSLLDIMDND